MPPQRHEEQQRKRRFHRIHADLDQERIECEQRKPGERKRARRNMAQQGIARKQGERTQGGADQQVGAEARLQVFERGSCTAR